MILLKRRDISRHSLLACLAAALLLNAAGQSAFSQTRKVDNNPIRIEQAKQIIAQNHQIVEQAKIYIAQAEKDLNDAQKLKGEARHYEKNLKLTGPMLKGKALSDARKQFKLDLSAFTKHVKSYNFHTIAVRKDLGQCKASKDAYEKMKKDLELHCDQFHMNNVEPPHICLQMDMTVQEALSAQSKLQQQVQRVADAERDLAKTEARLQKSITSRGLVDADVMKNSKLALKEQALAAEFGRLKEEHRQLDVERQALSRSGARVAVPAVKGTVKKN